MDSMERPGRPSRPLALTMLRAAKEGAGGSGNGIGSGRSMAVPDPKGAEVAVDVTTATSTMSNHLSRFAVPWSRLGSKEQGDFA